VNSLNVIQHTSADYLGLMEDHLEGRRIRFNYFRPFTEQGRIPGRADAADGLIVLGGGPWGSSGSRDVPGLAAEVELTRRSLKAGQPIIGIGLGAQVLALAAGGGSEPSELEFSVGYGRRVADKALNGFLPDRFPLAIYMRDRPRPPPHASILAVDEFDRPVIFQLGQSALGFCGHPGFKTAMAEDLIMEFAESPPEPAPQLEKLRLMMSEIEDALVPIMTGIIQLTGLMRIRRHIPLQLKT
jgi:GMP synthase-like glutamine amidotransferase